MLSARHASVIGPDVSAILGTIAARRLRPQAVATLVAAGGLAAWIVTVARMRGMDMGPGTDLGGLGWFLGIWVTMMAAMMLPSSLPMVLLVGRVAQGRSDARGPLGAARLGTAHGAYCVGCCAGLMLILFALGVMSLLWMAIVAALVYAEKVFPAGDRLSPLVAAALVGVGIWVAVDPGSFPGLVQPT